MEDDTALFLLRRELARPECAKGFVLDGLPRSVCQARKVDDFLRHAGQEIDKVWERLAAYLNQDVNVSRVALSPLRTRHIQVIELEVTDEAATRRLQNRLVHPPSGRVYNAETAPPKVPFTDDVTGEPLVRRADDVEEKLRTGEEDEWGSLARRLQVWKEETADVLGYYEKRGKLAVVAAEAGPAEVMRRVEAVLEGVGGKNGKGKGEGV